MLQALVAEDLRVATISYRLLTSAIPICADTAPVSGVLVHDLRGYSPALRPAAARAFGFAGQPIVSAVVPGSPADRAGMRSGDAIVSIDGIAVGSDIGPEDRTKPSYARIGAIVDRLDSAMARGDVAIGIARGGAPRIVTIAPVRACASPVQLDPSARRNATSDGEEVRITTALVEVTDGDGELAALIGHEIAHNLLHHRARLDAQGIGSGLLSRVGGKARKVRETEEEADYLGAYLAARAGYDPAAAATFWNRAGRNLGGGIFADKTHPDWRARAAAAVAAADEIAGKRLRGDPILPAARYNRPAAPPGAGAVPE